MRMAKPITRTTKWEQLKNKVLPTIERSVKSNHPAQAYAQDAADENNRREQ